MKKVFLLCALICAGQLYGMESEKLKYEDTYGSLPSELKQYIINTALVLSKDLPDAINAIKAFSTLHGVDYKKLNDITLVNALTDKFPEIVKDVIVFAVKQPELYQKVLTILKEKPIEAAIEVLKKERILQNNLKNFAILIHVIDNHMQSMLTLDEYFALTPKRQSIIPGFFGTPLANEYEDLGVSLTVADQPIKAGDLIQKGADINFNRATPLFGITTPLMYAVMLRKVDMVEFLLNVGANPYIKAPHLRFSGLVDATALDLTEFLLNQENRQAPSPEREKRKEKFIIIKTLLENAMNK